MWSPAATSGCRGAITASATSATAAPRVTQTPFRVVRSALMTGMDVVTRQTTLEYVAQQTTQLRAANEAQSKYLSFLSHDLRGGLNGVFLMIEVLRRELVKEPKFKESLEDLEMMRRSICETSLANVLYSAGSMYLKDRSSSSQRTLAIPNRCAIGA